MLFRALALRGTSEIAATDGWKRTNWTKLAGCPTLLRSKGWEVLF